MYVSLFSPVVASAALVRPTSPGNTVSAGGGDVGRNLNADQDSLELSPEAEAHQRSVSGKELDSEQLEQVEKLKARDQEVRQHEMAHLAAAGSYALGGPTYEYQKGPDGQNYAVGGEVQIDTAPVDGDPEATIRKAQIVRAAALAPAEPSSQDRAVAAQATQMEVAARAEVREQQDSEVEQVDGEAPRSPIEDSADGASELNSPQSNETPRPDGRGQPADSQTVGLGSMGGSQPIPNSESGESPSGSSLPKQNGTSSEAANAQRAAIAARFATHASRGALLNRIA